MRVINFCRPVMLAVIEELSQVNIALGALRLHFGFGFHEPLSLGAKLRGKLHQRLID